MIFRANHWFGKLLRLCGASIFILVAVVLCIPVNNLFKLDYSILLEDRDGHLLAAQIADDEQWRFPLLHEIPEPFEKSVITFEDKRFRSHPGIDIRAVLRAIKQNSTAGNTQSGASTITMQVARLSRKSTKRTLGQKLIEIAMAFKIELVYSKDEILRMWASHAPFGGNVVGLEAASWRYFNKAPGKLSLAESACLAVLPNAPSLIHPGKNREKLLAKRNRLLSRMYDTGQISKMELELAILEPLPQKPHPLPSKGEQLLHFAKKMYPDLYRIQTSLVEDIQEELLGIANFHHSINTQSNIENLGILVLDTYSGEVLAYVGNAPESKAEGSVDMVQALRSSGSVLKPLLYAKMLDQGLLMPGSLVMDIPTQIQGFNPRNYDRSYRGAVPANEAIARSLNVPAVRSLQNYGTSSFLNDLESMGFTSFDKNAEHYGLSLILGGAELSLWELCGVYASMGRTLIRFESEESKYAHNDFRSPSLIKYVDDKADLYFPTVLSAGSIYHAFEAMRSVSRPDREGNWEQFNSSIPVAWKTGTSYGHKDAWAVGVTKRYTIGVWVGNADGEGIHGLTGVKKAAPLFFDVLGALGQHEFFSMPLDALTPSPICRRSGDIASIHCETVDTLPVYRNPKYHLKCRFHQTIHLNNRGHRVNSSCGLVHGTQPRSWFVLPPSAALYYRKYHPEYKVLPAYDLDCNTNQISQDIMNFIYPGVSASIYLPVNRNGELEKVIFEVAHRNPGTTLYWHLDNNFIGETSEFHTLSVNASPGEHVLTVVDEKGNKISRTVEVKGARS